MKYTKGMYIKAMNLYSITGNLIRLPYSNGLIHIQFRRFAGCPICNLHLQSFVQQHQKIKDAGIREIIVFHSRQEEILKYTSGFPFDLIADPKKQLYRDFGVASSIWALLHPQAIITITRGIVKSSLEYFQGKRPLPALRPEGGSLGLPADFLIAPDGRIIDCHYGHHADDQWPVDELLQITTLAKQNTNQFKYYQL
jgi:peroxiredoxin